jgi:long-chain acyl-CoA synthetase
MVLKDGWLYTGDIGVMDEEGYLSIVDRKKDVIIAGGFNIYPKEIDEVLFEHPKVLEACTIGAPDAYRGETVKAYVVAKPGENLTAEEVVQFCKERLAPYKVPKFIEFIDSLPKSAVGKILRRELRDLDQKKREDSKQ